MSTIKTKNIKQTVISGTTQPLKIGGILEDGSDAKISIGSDGTTIVNANNIGLEFISTQSFSGVSSVSFNNCFSSKYDSYRIVIDSVASSTANTMLFRMRSNGTNTTESNYSVSMFYATSGNTTGIQVYGTGLVDGNIGINGLPTNISVDIHSPYLASSTRLSGNYFYKDGLSNAAFTAGFVNSQLNNTSIYDGISIYPTSNNFTGRISIYGYRK